MKTEYRLISLLFLEEKEMNKQFNIPSVLSYERKLAPSDGCLYGTVWERRNDEHAQTSLEIKEKSVRGTISNRLTEGQLKKQLSVENANPQTVDACFLGKEQDTLRLHFTLKIVPMTGKPSACNDKEFQDNYLQKVENYIKTYKFEELANRYAWNIANARFLWRNRVGAEKIEVRVSYDSEIPMVFDTDKFKLDSFNLGNIDDKGHEDDFKKLAGEIARTLCGERHYLMLNIDAYSLVGKMQEVYPSEELLLDKEKSEKSKVLYEVKGQAAIHSQKIGNALRTIDTWYKEDKDESPPISVEAYGSVTVEGKAYRLPKWKNDFYTLFDKYFSSDDGETGLKDQQKHYVLAMLIRGGVFGKQSDSGKAKKSGKKKDSSSSNEEDTLDNSSFSLGDNVE